MDLNLRKARKLEDKIAKFIDKISLKTTTEVRIKSSIEDAKALIDAEAKVFSDQLINLALLNKARYSLRNKIAQANTGTGITSLMTLREELIAEQTIITQLSIGGVSPTDSELADILEANRIKLEKGGNGFGEPSVNVGVNVVSKHQKEGIKKSKEDNTRKLEDIEDQLAQKNLGAKITLSNEELALLQANNLI